MRVRREKLGEKQPAYGIVEPRGKRVCTQYREPPTSAHPLIHDRRTPRSTRARWTHAAKTQNGDTPQERLPLVTEDRREGPRVTEDLLDDLGSSRHYRR